MSAEWTAESLDKLPEGTVIGWTEDGYPETAIRGDRSWRLLSGPELFSKMVMEDADPGSIRVVSVPIDALLTDDTILHAGSVSPRNWGWLKAGIEAAIAHITGEAA